MKLKRAAANHFIRDIREKKSGTSFNPLTIASQAFKDEASRARLLKQGLAFTNPKHWKTILSSEKPKERFREKNPNFELDNGSSRFIQHQSTTNSARKEDSLYDYRYAERGTVIDMKLESEEAIYVFTLHKRNESENQNSNALTTQLTSHLKRLIGMETNFFEQRSTFECISKLQGIYHNELSSKSKDKFGIVACKTQWINDTQLKISGINMSQYVIFAQDAVTKEITTLNKSKHLNPHFDHRNIMQNNDFFAHTLSAGSTIIALQPYQIEELKDNSNGIKEFFMATTTNNDIIRFVLPSNKTLANQNDNSNKDDETIVLLTKHFLYKKLKSYAKNRSVFSNNRDIAVNRILALDGGNALDYLYQLNLELKNIKNKKGPLAKVLQDAINTAQTYKPAGFQLQFNHTNKATALDELVNQTQTALLKYMDSIETSLWYNVKRLIYNPEDFGTTKQVAQLATGGFLVAELREIKTYDELTVFKDKFDKLVDEWTNDNGFKRLLIQLQEDINKHLSLNFDFEML